MASAALQDFRYLIIGGTTKAATTSLFFYLKEHPEVCAANWKEARFFLDNEYPLKSKYRFEDGLDKYADFYSHCAGDKLRVEATPDYLYSPGTPCKINNSLPHTKLFFMLREPVSRLVSWYRFAKQNGEVARDVSFDAYIGMLKKVEGQKGRKQSMLVLEQGCYSSFLQPYFKIFGRDRIYVAFYEEFQEKPTEILADICTFAGIDPWFYQEFDFKVHNRTETLRSPLVHKAYIGIRFQVRQFTHDKPWLHGCLSSLRQLVEPVYLRLNAGVREGTDMHPATARLLEDYYGNEVGALQELLGRNIPW